MIEPGPTDEALAKAYLLVDRMGKAMENALTSGEVVFMSAMAEHLVKTSVTSDSGVVQLMSSHSLVITHHFVQALMAYDLMVKDCHEYKQTVNGKGDYDA